MTQEIILIRGLPGSGKTTMAISMQTPRHEHYEADDHFTNCQTGDYHYDASKVNEAHRVCQQNTARALSAGKSVIVANTFTRKWEMKPYYDLASIHGCSVRVLVCRGEYENIHGVPADVIDRMRLRWED